MRQKTINHYMRYSSLIAFEKYRDKLSSDAMIYLNALLSLGGEAPDFKVAELLSWERARVSARRNELVQLDIVDAGDSEINPKTGISVICWKVQP